MYNDHATNKFAGLAFEQLLATLRTLRSPDGCPWDRQQTVDSLRSALIEECWELIATIDEQQEREFNEELGDVLLVVLLMALAHQSSPTEILTALNDKLIDRHPHVFAPESVKANSADQALASWHNAKFLQKKDLLLDSLPKSLPPLERAYKMQKRAARVGFDWSEVAEVSAKIEEELQEWRQAETAAQQQAELGDLLFSVVNLIRFCGFDPSLLLQQCNRKFYRRFCFVEEGMRAQGQPLDAKCRNQPAMEELWQRSKSQADKEYL